MTGGARKVGVRGVLRVELPQAAARMRKMAPPRAGKWGACLGKGEKGPRAAMPLLLRNTLPSEVRVTATFPLLRRSRDTAQRAAVRRRTTRTVVEKKVFFFWTPKTF